MDRLGDLDQLENLLRNAASAPGALADVDIDRARELLGDDAARSLEQLSELARMLEDAGLIEQKEGRLELTPRGLRADRRQRPRRPVLAHGQGQDGPPRRPSGTASATSAPTRPRRTSSATRSTSSIERTVRNAVARGGSGHAGAARPRRLRGRAHREPDPVLDRADARPVAVDADAGQLPRRQEGGDGAARADLLAVPARLPRASSASARWPGSSKPEQLPEVSWDFVYGTNMQHALRAVPPDAGPPDRAPSRSS